MHKLEFAVDNLHKLKCIYTDSDQTFCIYQPYSDNGWTDGFVSRTLVLSIYHQALNSVEVETISKV